MKCFVLFICLFTVINVSAQETLATDKQEVLGLVVHSGSILVHTKQVANTGGAKPLGFQLEASTLNTSYNNFKKWGFLSRSGFELTYFNFNTPILGSSYNAAYFIEPIFKLGNHAELRLKGAMGLGYLTKPNPNRADSSLTANFNYGSHLNSFLQLSLGATVHITNKLSAYVNGSFNHNSNAGFAVPNRGVNYPSISVGVLYHNVSNALPNYKRVKDVSWRTNNRVKYYAGIFASAKDGWSGVGNKYNKRPLIGSMLLASKQVSNINAITAGVEAYYDGGLHETKTHVPDNSSSFFASILVGNEFLLDKFTLSQQLGYHVYRNTDYYNTVYLKNINPLLSFYQRYGITYKVSANYKVGFSFLARGDFADFIDLRVLYRFK